MPITSSPAGLSRVNGVRRSSAKTWNFNPSVKALFYINWFKIWRGSWVITLGRSPTLPNLVLVRWAVEQPRGATYKSCDFFCCFFCSLKKLQPIPVNQFPRTIAQKTRSGASKTLLGWKMCSCEIRGCFTRKTPIKWSGMGYYQPK